ncbi:MAG: hypothetical protein OXH84_01600 [Gammaproteobacteria bacterium]|nr:hypothetical protein [Gammaproteobacteria bacterium]
MSTFNVGASSSIGLLLPCTNFFIAIRASHSLAQLKAKFVPTLPFNDVVSIAKSLRQAL